MLAITNGTLIDGRGGDPQTGMTILIDGERITETGRTVDVPRDATMIDAGGGSILPGLIDTHVHFMMQYPDVLRGLLDDHFAGTLSTQEFIAAFEQRLPEWPRYEDKKSLQWFLDGWVNGVAIPKFEITHLRLTQRNGTLIASGKLLQSQAPDTLVTSVPLYAFTGHGSPAFLRRIFADGQETSFKFTAPAGTKKILVDPYNTVLRRP